MLRTPEEYFDGLPGYAFKPHYLDDLKAGAKIVQIKPKSAA